MCELTQPTPGLVVDILHPNFAWVFFTCKFIWGIEYARIRSAKDGTDATMSAEKARRLALVAGACWLVAMMVAFLIYPSDSLLRVWRAQQEAALPAYCAGTVEDAARRSALETYSLLFFVALGMWLASGGVLLERASKGRGLPRLLSIS